MPTYIMLAKWTDQGIRSAKESPRRLDAAKKALKEMGGEFKTFYLTMGDYDMVGIYEAPDDAVAARFILQLGAGAISGRAPCALPQAVAQSLDHTMDARGYPGVHQVYRTSPVAA